MGPSRARGDTLSVTRARLILPWICLLLWAGFVVPGPPSLSAQEEGDVSASRLQVPGENLRVSLVTMGEGDIVWERFGHNALHFQDVETGWEVAYHWGVFNFQQLDFIPRLIRGTMLYSMGQTDLAGAVREYERAGRPVWVQELALTPAQRLRLLQSVEENARPENRDYSYDYYRDNCSTRIRDFLDQALDGALQAQFSSDTTEVTYRWHTRRALRPAPGYYLGIQFVLGPNADRPITVWEEMFLPLTLKNRIGEVQVPTENGGTESLVRQARLAVESRREDGPVEPPFAFPLFLLAGLLWGGGILALTGPGTGLGPGRRFALATLAGGWSLLAALAGSLLLGAWLFTDHYFWYENLNLLQTNPLFFPLPLAFLLFLFRNRFPEWGKGLAVLLGIVSVVGVLIWLLPWPGQKNTELLGLSVPINIALAICVIRLCRR